MTQTSPLLQSDPVLTQASTMRPAAQQSLVASATFDSILQERREPPAEPAKPSERESAADTERETARNADETGREDPKAKSEGAESSKDSTNSGTSDGSGSAGDLRPTNGEDAKETTDAAARVPTDTSADTSRVPTSTPEKAVSEPIGQPSKVGERAPGQQLAEEAPRTRSREFIAIHGKKAAKLRWDSAGVQLSHAAEVSVADKNAKELASRAERPVAERPVSELTQPVQDRNGLQKPGRAASAPQQAAPTATTASSGQGVRADTGGAAPADQPAPAHVTARTTAHVVAAPDASGASDAASRGLRHAGEREALIARLGTVGGNAASSKANAGRVTAINALGKASPRTANTSKAGVLRQAASRDQSGVLRQVQQGLAKLLKAEGGSTTLRLNPKSLGEVTVHLQVQHGKAEARLTPTNDVARSLLQSGLKELKAALETRGLRVERLTVDPVPHKASAEPTTEPRAESRATRADDGPSLDQRQDADSNPGGSRGSPEQHPGHGRAGHAHMRDESRSEDAPSPEQTDRVPHGTTDAGWLRLDTLA